MSRSTRKAALLGAAVLGVAAMAATTAGSQVASTGRDAEADAIYRPFVAPSQGPSVEHAWPAPPGLPALPRRVGVGRPAPADAVRGWDIDVRGDGEGLPPGSGTVAQGEELYVQHCAACHGDFGEGIDRWPALIGGRGSLNTGQPRRTVGSYWPHAPVVFDYIRRAMPYPAPQSLGNDDYYAITAYVLHLNELLPEDATVDAEALRKLRMPNRDGFVLEARPDTPNAACMTNCRDGRPVTITMDSRQFVQPGSGSGFSEPQ